MKRVPPEQIPSRRSAVEVETLARAGEIVDDVRARGEAALLGHAARLGDWQRGEPWLLDAAALRHAFEAQPAEVRNLLERTAARIRRFAQFQLDSVRGRSLPIEGGEAGFTLAPVVRAGCYAPGGKFPLPSSVLMTAVTARVAGVESVVVASPHPTPVTLAAAQVAGADEFLAIGGAQAIAALAFGAGPLAAVDVIVGPGNRWVTAAKHIVSGTVGIDLLAGPSELVVIADDSADASTIAADLLAQAEHDADALPVLITTSTLLADSVDREIQKQLATLGTAETARAALRQGYVVMVTDIEEAAALVNRIAPEHVQLMVRDAESLAGKLRNAGAVFIGAQTAEVLGDYGAGPNHVLPTGATARFSGGLSVLTFLRMRTWLRIDDPTSAAGLVRDAAALAELEGLEGHARSARTRVS